MVGGGFEFLGELPGLLEAGVVFPWRQGLGCGGVLALLEQAVHVR